MPVRTTLSDSDKCTVMTSNEWILFIQEINDQVAVKPIWKKRTVEAARRRSCINMDISSSSQGTDLKNQK
jgi:hypothetical protein